MNIFDTCIFETKEGELLVVWGGRRIVTQCLVPPLADFEGEEEIERVWKRRYRYDSGALIITRIYDNYTKRIDYNSIILGRNPAIIKDITGRIWVGYRIPVISAQDPMGVNYYENPGYVRPTNVGTTAGMNFWQVFRADDFSQVKGAFPFEWFEQTTITQEPLQITDDNFTMYDFATAGLNGLLTYLSMVQGDIGGEVSESEGMKIYTEFTQHPLTGDLYLRGMGGNLLDTQQTTRFRYYEKEGLRNDTSVVYNHAGQQVRISNEGVITVTLSDTNDERKQIGQVSTAYGNIRQNKYGDTFIATYDSRSDIIPYQIISGRNYDVLTTHDFETETKYEDQWAQDNEKEWVIENANVPGEGYFSWETPPTAEEQEKIRRQLAYYYYDLPLKYNQKPGYWISQYTGLHFICWMHGNLTAVKKDDGTYTAVGLRIAVSGDEGKTFRPLIPERVLPLQGVE